MPKTKLSYSDKRLSTKYLLKKRHFSTNSLQKDSQSVLAALEIIENLINKSLKEGQEKDRIASYQLKVLQNIQKFDNLYSILEQNLEDREREEIRCVVDQQPVPESKVSQEGNKKLPIKLKRKVFNHSELAQSIRESDIESKFIEKDRKTKDSLIINYKRQYSILMNTKYLSQSICLKTQPDQQDDDMTKLLKKMYYNETKLKLKLKHNKIKINRMNSSSLREDVNEASQRLNNTTHAEKNKQSSMLRNISKISLSKYNNKKSTSKDEFVEINMNNIDQFVKNRKQMNADTLNTSPRQSITVKESNEVTVSNHMPYQKIKIKGTNSLSEHTPPMFKTTTIHLDKQNKQREEIKQFMDQHRKFMKGKLTNKMDRQERNSQSVMTLPRIQRR